jgi:hypothetical protein
MHKPTTYHHEQSIFTAATEGLILARQRGAVDKSGNDAINATMRVRYERMFSRCKYGEQLAELMMAGHQDNEYFKKLGMAVELAVELSETVDQQR